jgi:hypothetical protein
VCRALSVGHPNLALIILFWSSKIWLEDFYVLVMLHDNLLSSSLRVKIELCSTEELGRPRMHINSNAKCSNGNCACLIATELQKVVFAQRTSSHEYRRVQRVIYPSVYSSHLKCLSISFAGRALSLINWLEGQPCLQAVTFFFCIILLCPRGPCLENYRSTT